ncbi:Stk1 family PASTA domain-containing Ser/Thr kinase [Planotetraspora phitsanulokensis]|uniref:non-specific serine/threonine protein kinase n=1 Tax=Planotetraspora phitsanulokensis TaxID=575192 RepID=A0A8J3TZ73_9ACTN|nr:Stk1 family PASTA domain-containing Ser/Thr kinase [Planotetraspora phitsanulokensis]GII35304.1 serine/threonine protein kinase [Planotetraspora phitsanulokensis]
MDTTLTDPIVGHVLDGRYRVESRIARGGMASVYLALDVRLDRTVAVKVMHHTLAEDPQFVRRFIGEARSVASLSHPNIVQVFDQGTDGKHVYLSMEYVPGRTLRDVLRSRGRLPAREALEIVIPVLAALGAAHQAGLIHRDVKPENVLLTDDGRVKVVDFGLARAVEATNQTKTGMMIGTIGYMSPEQVTSGVADSRSDVYSVGIMLFELLTGRQPYEGDTPMSVAYRHVHDSVPAPSTVVGDISPSLDALLAAATDRDPAKRPSDATAMLVAAVEVHRTLPKTPAKNGQHAAPGPVTPLASPAEPYSTGQMLAVGAHTPKPVNRTMVQPRGDLLTTPQEGHSRSVIKRRSTWFVAGLALLMVAGVALTGWWFSGGRYTKVPDLLNQNITVAKQTAEQQGFVVKIGQARFDEHVGKDMVLDSDPEVGTEVAKGALITLIPSAGPETVTVPKVQGMSEADAREAIGKAGLSVGRVSKAASDTVARGLIVKTSPDVGRRVRKNSSVNLVISAGLLMPDVTQMMRDQAEQFLREKGFNVQIDETTDDTPPGTVIAQDPAGGSETVAGANVRLTVSRGPDQGWHWPWENEGDQAALVQVPDVRFKSVEDAQNELKAAGFKVKTRNLVGTQRVVGEQPLGQQPAGTQIMIWH